MNWQEQCAEIISFLEGIFPETTYRIVFKKQKDNWAFHVESVRSDGGSHHGAAVSWISVDSEKVEALPSLLLLKAQKRVNEWQQEGLEVVRKQALELEKAKNELDKRLNAHIESLAKRVNDAGSQTSNSDTP